MSITAVKRCEWCLGDPLLLEYHDAQWGVPVHDDRLLFEMLILGGAQAGLSWLTVLKKREQYRRAFDDFDAEKIARYSSRKIAALLRDGGIIRNRLKLEAAVRNAAGVLRLRDEYGALDKYLWSFTGGRPLRNRWKTLQDIPAETDLSRAMSKDLRRRGFNFVGPTICYALMQSVGLVNDHLVTCFRHAQL